MNCVTEKKSSKKRRPQTHLSSKGVAERALGIIEAAGLVARIQASELYPDERIPNGDNLWVEQAVWACHALNRTATPANPK